MINRSRGRSFRPSTSRFSNARRPGQRPQRRPQGKGAYIHPSKFVNRALAPAEETPYEPTHRFADFAISAPLLGNITAKGLDTPSPIQDQAIPLILDGKDVVGLANTGTGKTAAFLIPTIEKLVGESARPSVLIVTPTRELATQIEQEFVSLTRSMRLYATVVVGGMNIDRQIRDLRRGPNIVIGTPGRLKDLIQRRAIDLRQVNTYILDEADRMLDMGFVRDIEFITAQLPPARQTLCFSATVTPQIAALFETMMQQPVTVSVRRSETSDHVEQDVVHAVSKDHKIELLGTMLADAAFEKVLIFGQTKYGVQRLADTLSKNGFPAEAIHGNKNQNQRQRSLDKFKQDHVRVLVATDVAARGLDIPNVSHVINFDQPGSYDDYVHRIGRTGRAGKRGTALTFVDKPL